ncbi:hypothetical protein [Thermodesulfobacterium thermophilum]|uniref:hypothetical protein n=1 Tax=Thermodesulfobacterium thermophilum TaxID=886 RepID=UPI0003B56F79|nr:hypothetical protein [Thermodesulfobacterium thermophilum]
MITEKEFQMKLLEKLAPQYKQAKSKKLKSQILSQFCELTQLSREAAKKRFQRYFKRRSTYFSPKKRTSSKIPYSSPENR